jgi:hypothetical protein
MSRADGVIFERIPSMRKDGVFEFDDRLLPFDRQVEIVLTEVDAGSGPQNLGSVFIRADELNRGELTQQFRGGGALYDLTYKVI